jgi:branched-chain amino acid transport system substrate-binding protein
MSRHRPFLRWLAVAALASTIAAACSSSDATTTSAAGSSAAPSSSAEPDTFGPAYVGATAGAADSSRSKIVIGYVNQEGGVPAFPESTAGADAAVEYVNRELSGVQGHPIELKKCVVQTEEDGQKCGIELLNDDSVKAVVTGVLTVGGKSLYGVLAGKKPVIIGNPVVTEDFVTKDTFALTPGSPGVIQGLAIFIAKNLTNVHKVAMILGSNPGAQAAFDVLFKPVINKLGITDVTSVTVSDTATGPDVQSALQAAGADKADVLVPLVTVQGCIATFDALQSLAITPQVVTSGLCLGTPMTQHLKDIGVQGDVPNGWYFGGYGYSYFLPDQASGMNTYLAKIHQYGPKDVEFTGFAGPTFATVLTLVKFMNAVGADAITTDAINAQILAFKGPMMLVAGPMSCGTLPLFTALCGVQMGVEQYKDGQWIPTADALNGKAIDTSKG